jgi:phosphatidylserine/phosphatidylglycerophosphate/cardiolipin synthase-like enzyme
MRDPELRTGNAVTFLVDGPATFQAMHRAILTARTSEHYIYLLGWHLTDDFPLVPPRQGVPTSIRDLFAAASQRGVQVRAMLWDQRPLSGQNRAEVQHINALPNGAAIYDNYTFSDSSLVNVGSHHQKVLIVKGEEGLIGFCGGVDINPNRVLASPPTASRGSGSGSGGGGDPLHDVHCQITGPSTFDLLSTFIRRWYAHPEHISHDRRKGDLRGCQERVPSAVAAGAGSGGANTANCAVRITRTYQLPPASPWRQLPGVRRGRRELSIRQSLRAAIQNARRFIYMEDQYLTNLEAAALLNAALAHIDHLTILIADSSLSDMPGIWAARARFIDRLTRGPFGHKAHVFILSSPPNLPGTRATFGPHTYVHAKTWIFDDEVAVIGSANCNNRGWTHDSELNAVIFETATPEDLTFAQRLRMRLWSEHLGVTPEAVRDVNAGVVLWASSLANGRTRPYNPTAGSDRTGAGLIQGWIGDPSGPV